MSIVTRFAPSPTGYLHIGSVRTALFSWVFAKQQQGKFILRIEDTDAERSTQEAVDVILQGLQWLNMDYDGPYYQTKRLTRYEKVINQLLEHGKAYKCYCSKQRLDKLREQQLQQKAKPKYDGFCLKNLPNDPNVPFVVRFKNPTDGFVKWEDLVRGTITIANQELDDVIIRRPDGMPTYNLAVVVDDADMGVNHVIRGDDHINNTPRQINLLNALEFTIPQYAHIPMILGEDSKRLSKRHGAVNVMQYEQQGILPAALLNYLSRLGWSHQDAEIFSIQEMIKWFSFKHVNKSPAKFNQEKLLWLNAHYMKELPKDEMLKHFTKSLANEKITTDNGPDIAVVADLLLNRAQSFQEMAQKARFFYQAVIEYDTEAVEKHITDQSIQYLSEIKVLLNDLTTFDAVNIKQLLKDFVKQKSIKFPHIAQPLRIALTGNMESPSIDVTVQLLTKAEVQVRIDKFMNFYKR